MRLQPIPEADQEELADAAQCAVSNAPPNADTKRFQLLPPRRSSAKVPRATDVQKYNQGPTAPFPQAVQERIGSPAVVVGFDIKTHNWLRERGALDLSVGTESATKRQRSIQG